MAHCLCEERPFSHIPSVHLSVQPLLSFSTHTGHPTCSDRGLLQPTAAPCPAQWTCVPQGLSTCCPRRGERSAAFPLPTPGCVWPGHSLGSGTRPQNILTGRQEALTAGPVTH